MVNYEKAFNDFDAAGGRRALEQQLTEIDRVAQESVREGVEPDSRLMALREGLQRLLAALNDLASTTGTADQADRSSDADQRAGDDRAGESDTTGPNE